MSYNGHKTRAHWNVSLWLYNDEYTYNQVQSAIVRAADLDGATALLMRDLPSKTPDNVSYTHDTVRDAIEEDFQYKLTVIEEINGNPTFRCNLRD